MRTRVQAQRDAAQDRAGAMAALLACDPLPLICDVGANPRNVPCYRALLRAGGCRVVGFEPQQDACDRLCAEAGPHESYVNAALGTSGRARLHSYAAGGYTSLYRLRPGALEMIGRDRDQPATETVHEITLTALDDVEGLGQIDMLKIDVQGAERDVIVSGAARLAQAVAILPEVPFIPLYEGAPSFGDLDSALRAQGFVLHKLLPPVRYILPSSQRKRLARAAAASQWVDGDAVYVRNLETIGDWTDDQLRKLALFAATCFDSADLAALCLDHLVARGALPAGTSRTYATGLPAAYLKQTAAPRAAAQS